MIASVKKLIAKCVKFIGGLSFKTSFVLYIVEFLALSALIFYFTFDLIGMVHENIANNYIDKYVLENYDSEPYIAWLSNSLFYVENGDAFEYVAFSTRVRNGLIAVETSGYVLSTIFVIITLISSSMNFYRNKVKKPFEILQASADKIANNELDFVIQYDNTDEFGKLCGAFEKMRSSLEANNSIMWQQMEDRKKLNSAFSHDLRTPLTVLKGQTELLIKFVPDEKISKEKAIESLKTMKNHISRLENYVYAMNKLQKLEDVGIVGKKVNVASFQNMMQDSAKILCADLSLNFVEIVTVEELVFDSEIFMEIYENILTNAIRYGKENIEIIFEADENEIKFSVKDDGVGFSHEDLNCATNPFYRGNCNINDDHFGLGLNICSVLVKKLGGKLNLANNIEGGAIVTVAISV